MKIFPKLILLGLGIFLFLAGSELFLRIINYPFQGCKKIEQVDEARIGVFDPDTGWAYENNSEKIGEYGTLYAFTKEGYRASHSSVLRDPTKPVILVVGDSMLFGHGLPFEDSFSNVLSNRLNNKYEVLNFSVQAFGTDQMYVRLKKLLPIYKPKLVIISYLADHDQRNMSEDRRDFFPCHTFPGTKPRFEVRDGKLVQVHVPNKEQEYDRFRLRILLKKTGLHLLQDTSIGSSQLSATIINSIILETKNAGSQPFIISFGNIKDSAGKDSETYFSTIQFLVDQTEEHEQYYISASDHHPNKVGTEKMIQELLPSVLKSL